MPKTKVSIDQVSELTSNNNRIIRMRVGEGRKEVMPGVFKTQRSTYYMAVDGDSTVALGDSELDFSDYKVVERAFDHPEEGEIMLKWLHNKGAGE